MSCAMRSLFAVAAMLAANEACAFVHPAGLTFVAGRSVAAPSCTSVERSSRRWDKAQQLDAGNGDGGSSGEQPAGPFSSWVKKTAGRIGRGPFSRAAKKDEVDDLLNSDAFLHKKVEMLQKQINATQADIVTAQAQADEQWAEWGPQVQRLEKEFSALKGRGGEARTQAYNKGKAEAINNILGVADNFERAAGAISAETDGERAVVAYYKDTYDNMMKCLEGLDLVEVDTIGAPFDYNIHNAIMRENTDEFPEDVVCKVFQKGYQVGDTLVRPAMVAVAVPP
ncbi:unnamed protein product [Ectocarpus sp. 13 AM-2016]